jgi:uncharacterized protein (TIGR02646 family)
MIRVRRSGQPAILGRRADLWKQKLLAARARYRQAGGADRAAAARLVDSAEEKYRHEQVKQALLALFHGKCAYCESKITHVDYGHIEHYRPKSRFPEHTFEWSNLLLACGVCNGAGHKGDHFPEEAEGGPLIDPCSDDPAQHLTFRYDPAAKLASVYGTTSRGQVTETLLGLNRPELRALRSLAVRKLAALARFAETDPEARELLHAALRDDAQYAAFARSLTAPPEQAS